MPQTNYQLYMDKGYEGQIITSVPHTIRKYTNGHSDVLPYGLGVTLDSSDPGLIKLFSATGQFFAGILTLDYYHEDQVKNLAFGLPGIPVKGDASVGEIGEFLVFSEQAVSPTDPVFCRHTAGGANIVPGRFRKDADTAKADQVTGARWKYRTTAAGLTTLILNRP